MRYDRFELDQLMKSGAVKVTQRANFDPDDGVLPATKEAAVEREEEEATFDVELNDNEPAFLVTNQSTISSLHPSNRVCVLTCMCYHCIAWSNHSSGQSVANQSGACTGWFSRSCRYDR